MAHIYLLVSGPSIGSLSIPALPSSYNNCSARMSVYGWINKSFEMASPSWRNSGEFLGTVGDEFMPGLVKGRRGHGKKKHSATQTKSASTRDGPQTRSTGAAPSATTARPTVPTQTAAPMSRPSMPRRGPPDMSSMPPGMSSFQPGTFTGAPMTQGSGPRTQPTRTARTTAAPFYAGPGGQPIPMQAPPRTGTGATRGMMPPTMGAGSMPFTMPEGLPYEGEYDDGSDNDSQYDDEHGGP